MCTRGPADLQLVTIPLLPVAMGWGDVNAGVWKGPLLTPWCSSKHTPGSPLVKLGWGEPTLGLALTMSSPQAHRLLHLLGSGGSHLCLPAGSGRRGRAGALLPGPGRAAGLGGVWQVPLADPPHWLRSQRAENGVAACQTWTLSAGGPWLWKSVDSVGALEGSQSAGGYPFFEDRLHRENGFPEVPVWASTWGAMETHPVASYWGVCSKHQGPRT